MIIMRRRRLDLPISCLRAEPRWPSFHCVCDLRRQPIDRGVRLRIIDVKSLWAIDHTVASSSHSSKRLDANIVCPCLIAHDIS
jgi:hypothetical protein